MKSIAILLLLIPAFLFAQQTIDVGKQNVNPVASNLFYTVNGTPFSNYKYTKVVSGSPYYNDEWMKGIAILKGNQKAQCDFVKLDLLSGEIIYKDSTGQELIATTPVQQLSLLDPLSGKEIVFINSAILPVPGSKIINGWYQVLEKGSATLYKKIKKSISERQLFNSATAEQTINTDDIYYVGTANDVNAVKKPKDIPIILSDKKAQLDEYITANKLNSKTDESFTEVVSKYNALAAGH